MKKKITFKEFLEEAQRLFPNDIIWGQYGIVETLNFKAPITWTQKGSFFTGEFSIDDREYGISLEYGTYENQYGFFNAAFFIKNDEGKPTYELVKGTKNPLKIISTVVRGVREKIKDYDYVALVFAAADNVHRRMDIYNKIAESMAKEFGTIHKNIKNTDGGLITILFNKELPKEQQKYFAEYIKQKEQDK